MATYKPPTSKSKLKKPGTRKFWYDRPPQRSADQHDRSVFPSGAGKNVSNATPGFVKDVGKGFAAAFGAYAGGGSAPPPKSPRPPKKQKAPPPQFIKDYFAKQPRVPTSNDSNGSPTVTLADQLKNYKFTDPSIIETWINQANPTGLAQADIDRRVNALATLGQGFARGAERVKAQGADLTAKQAAADQNFMKLAASYAPVQQVQPTFSPLTGQPGPAGPGPSVGAPVIEEQNPVIQAAMLQQGQAQNTDMAMRAQGNTGVMNQISQIQAQAAEDQQAGVAAGQNEVRASYGAELENQKRLAREAAIARYGIVRSHEQDVYNQLAQQVQNENELAIANAKLQNDPNSQKFLLDQGKLLSQLRGQTGEAAGKFQALLDAMEAKGGNYQQALEEPGVADYGISQTPGKLGGGSASDLAGAIIQAYAHGGSGADVTRALRNYYRQQGYTDAATMRPLIDEFYRRAPLKKSRKRPK